MLIKRVSPYDYPYPDEQLVTIIEPSMTKQAGIDVSDIRYEAETVKFHVIALGAGEYWGSNRNGDFFPEAALIEYHPTFVKFGNFHKNHKNKPHDPKYGWVEKSWYNPRMRRVELIVVCDLNKYPEFKEKLESGKDIPVSMAAKLPYDLCSICGHRRTKPGREYSCKHINDELTKILPDGRQVYAINDKPKFFDISEVWKPADRTAYVLQKIASSRAANNPLDVIMDDMEKCAKYDRLSDSNNSYVSQLDNAIDREHTMDLDRPMHKKSNFSKNSYVEPHIRKQAWDKIAFIDKLSELEKQVEGEVAGKVEDGKIEAVKSGITSINLPDKVIDSLSELPKATTYASLADKGIILRPKEFMRLNKGPTDSGLSKILPLIRGIFSKLSRRNDLENFYPESDYDLGSVPEHSKVSRLFRRFIEPRTILREPAVKRSMTIIIVGGPSTEKLDTNSGDLEKESSYNEALAIMYGLYKASALKYILEKNKDTSLDTNNVTAISAILENYI